MNNVSSGNSSKSATASRASMMLRRDMQIERILTQKWTVNVVPVSPSAALPKCLLHRARFLPPQKIPEQLLLLASTERLRLG
jgi:hypothetical protein